MRIYVIAFVNSSLYKIEIFSIFLFIFTGTISGQSLKPLDHDSLATTQKDIIDVLPIKIRTFLRKDSTLQKSKQVSLLIIPIDHQYLLSCNSNIIFNKLKLHLSGAARYYNSPTNIYGIGDNVYLTDVQSIDFSYLRVYQIAYRELVPHLFAGLGYNLDYHWGIKANLAPGKVSKEFERLQKGSSSVSSAISFNVQFDNRKNAINPQTELM